MNLVSRSSQPTQAGGRASERFAAYDSQRHPPVCRWQPAVSVLVPCRNEVEFIGGCLESIISNGYPHDRLEILVVDGTSVDGTREVVGEYSQRFPFVRLIDNPERITPRALNLGIEAAAGEVVIRMDAHATYNAGYISECVDALERYGVDNTGGCWNVVARGEEAFDRAIVRVMSHRFGGAASYRNPANDEPQFDELIPFFCCRRETLLAVGPFNERLLRHQDFEFTTRMRRLGGRLLLVPRAICNYYARTDLPSFALHSFRDGMWVIRAAAHADVVPLSLRHLVPMVFVFSLVASSMAVFEWRVAAAALSSILAVWMSCAAGCGIVSARRRHDWTLAVTMPVTFLVRHVMFGAGSLAGTTYLAGSVEFWRRMANLILSRW